MITWVRTLDLGSNLAKLEARVTDLMVSGEDLVGAVASGENSCIVEMEHDYHVERMIARRMYKSLTEFIINEVV